MKHFILLFIVATAVTSCAVSYSFTGTSTGNAKTISIETFSNRAPLTPPEYTQTFTEDLKEQYLRQTNLDLVKENGDFQISGFIQQYYSYPIATTAEESTSQNRLQVSVQVKFVNTLDPTQNFDRKFMRFEDYSSEKSLNDIQDELFTLIMEQLGQDIIQASIGSW